MQAKFSIPVKADVSRKDTGSLDLPTFWSSSDFYSNELLPRCRTSVLFRVLIASSLENSERRANIRQTWCNPQSFGKPKNAWNCIFLVGQIKTKKSSSLVHQEQKKYSDLLVGNYFDSYRNLTFKVIHGFNWSANHCPSLYVVKTDDDCFVNTGAMYNFLMHHNTKTSNLYAGRIVTKPNKLEVVRTKEKWSVSYKDYPDKYYPPYASGIGYILSADVVDRLAGISDHIKPFANEDAFVGVVMSKLNVMYTSTNRFSMTSFGLTVCNFLYVFLIHSVTPQIQHELMAMALAAPKNCSHMKPITTW